MKDDQRQSHHDPGQPDGGDWEGANPDEIFQRSRADGEPVVRRGGVPLWMVILLGLMVWWGFVYLDKYGGGFSPDVYGHFNSRSEVEAVKTMSPEERAIFQGRQSYMTACSLCHQATGEGLPGQFPPLAGSEWVTAPSPERLIRIALHGLQGPIEVRGETWNAMMPAMGAALSEEELANTLSYIRNAWGHEASMVTVEEVAQVKQETQGRAAPWTADQLLQVQLSEPVATEAE